MIVRYLEAHDKSGRYRWWTEDMALVGQFDHADTLEEIKVTAALSAGIPASEVELEEQEEVD